MSLHSSEVLSLIAEYLSSHNLTGTLLTLSSELHDRGQTSRTLWSQASRVRNSLKAGDWVEVERLCAKPVFKPQRVFLFAVYRQQFLELCEAGDHAKALQVLVRRIKPLESVVHETEFQRLCALITARGVVAPPREDLCESLDEMLTIEPFDTFFSNQSVSSTGIGSGAGGGASGGGLEVTLDVDRVPEHRLEHLLQQALAYQGCPRSLVESGNVSLLMDYQPSVIPQIFDPLLSYTCHLPSFSFASCAFSPSLSSGMPSGMSMPNTSYRAAATLKDMEQLGEGLLPAAVKAVCFVPVYARPLSSVMFSYTAKSRCWDLATAPYASWHPYPLVSSAHADGSVCLYSISSSPSSSGISSGSSDSSLFLEQPGPGPVYEEGPGILGSQGVFEFVERSGIMSIAHPFAKDRHLSSRRDSGQQLPSQSPQQALPQEDSEEQDDEGGGVGRDQENMDNEKEKSGKSSRVQLRLVHRFASVHMRDVYACRFISSCSSPLLLVSGGFDRKVQLIDANTQQTLLRNWSHAAAVTCVDVVHAGSGIGSAGGKLIVSGARDSNIKFWDMSSGTCLRTISQHLGELSSIEASRCGRYVLSASKDNSVRLWDIRTWKMLNRFRGHQNTAKNHIRARFACDDKTVIAGSEDGSVRIWDVASGDTVAKLDCEGGCVLDVRYSAAQGGLLAAGTDAGRIRVFRAPVHQNAPSDS
eukprot:ANDGO_02958.mRNA.1 Protein will die slowly